MGTGGTRALAHAAASRLRAVWARRPRSDAGMTTAEYAMGTIAACAFAAVLYKVVTGTTVQSALQSLIGRALHATF
ncbi:DUF4244 domain-containing protein [Streptomyces sp. NPDC047002]|uniref:DUF4244 domain-containing protein n=1 Tax=Streptomyces sp. NPDC047002 TaxID=3155475 RepID=UPI003454AB82